MFVGSVADNFTERIEQKIFHCEIEVDAEQVQQEESKYRQIPVITDFIDKGGNDFMAEQIQENYHRIKQEVKQIVADELERIRNTPELSSLLQSHK
jgi:putative methionine-R-sulfoxide reductase with GAF domain